MGSKMRRVKGAGSRSFPAPAHTAPQRGSGNVFRRGRILPLGVGFGVKVQKSIRKALKIKDFEVKCRRLAIMHGRTPVKYSIILHGKRGSGKANCIYQHGCFIYYRPDGSFRISKVNRKSKAFLAMLKTARYFGGEIETQEQEQITKEGKILSKKQLEIRKRVLKNYKGFVSI